MAIDDAPSTATELVVPLEGGARAALAIPDTASSEECAAVAAAIGAHLTDRQRASADANGPPPADRWKLAGRLGVRRHDRLPRRVARGEEWKAAARTWK